MKNIKLLAILGVQLIVIVILFFSGRSSTRLDFDTQLFTVSDTAAISKLELIQGGKLVSLQKSNNGWLIDGKEEADPSLMVYLTSVLNRVAVTRPISTKQRELIYQALQEEGVLVKVFNGEQVVKEFYAGGNAAKTKSYFGAAGKPYIVNVPGYQDYLSGIFKLKAHQWKDRLIYSSSWRSVSKIIVEKQEEEGFSVLFTGKDLTVAGVVPLDSNVMMNYIGQYQQFMINEFILPGQFDRYDSLAKTDPLATILLEDLDQSKNLKVSVFPSLPAEGYHLLTDDKGRMMMVDRQRVANLVPPRKVFVKREKPRI